MNNSEHLIEAVQEEVGLKRMSNNEEEILREKDVRDVLQALENMGYSILKNESIKDDYQTEIVSGIIQQWLPEEWKGSQQDIPGAQILLDLQSKGWVILPPES